MNNSRPAKQAIEPRKQPQQKRSSMTVEAILQAAILTLKRRGLHGFNTNIVAETAGISVGSLYQYFPSKDAILTTLIRTMRREMRDAMTLAVTQAKTGEIRHDAAVFIEASLRHHLDHADIVSVLEQAEADLPLDTETLALKAEMRQLVIALLTRCEIADAETCADDLITISHALSEKILQDEGGHFDEIARRLKRAVFGCLADVEQTRPTRA